MPVRRFGDQFGKVRRHAGFLLQLAERRHQRVLAVVDAALRHLPRLQLGIEPLPNKDMAIGVDQQHADAGAIGQAGLVGAGDGGAHASSINAFKSFRHLWRSSCADGIAPRSVMLPWICPAASRKLVRTPAAMRRPA